MDMETEHRNRLRERVAAWQRVSVAEDAWRRSTLPSVDTGTAIQAFDSLFKEAIRVLPSRTSSGLTEQQKWFKRLRM